FWRSSAREWARRASSLRARLTARPPGGAGRLRLELLPATGCDLHGHHLGRRLTTRGCCPDLGFDLARQRRVLAQVVAHVLASLPEALIAIRHPRAALVEDRVLQRRVDERALARDAFVEQDVELRGSERWRDLVLDHLDLDSGADRVEPVLDHFDLADVEPDR